MPDSKGGVCDILSYSPEASLRSSWSTIASPRFNVYEKDRSCDDLNSLQLDKESPRARILTGKTPIVNIEAEEEAVGTSHNNPLQFLGFPGDSFFHGQSISTKPKFTSRPIKSPPRPESIPLKAKPTYSVQPSNQKIQIEPFSQTASLLLGRDGKTNILTQKNTYLNDNSPSCDGQKSQQNMQ